MFSSLFAFFSNFAQRLPNGSCMKFSGKLGNIGPVNKRLNSGGNLICHLDTGIASWIRLLLGDTESGIDWLRCVMLQCTACTSRHRHSNYDVITSPAHDRRALAEVCTVPVLLVTCILQYCGKWLAVHSVCEMTLFCAWSSDVRRLLVDTVKILRVQRYRSAVF